MPLLEDLRSALRALARRPLHAIVAVTILSLGLAAAVTVFTWFNAYSRPFPGASQPGLVRLFGTSAEDPLQDVAYLDFRDYAELASETFAGVTAAQLNYAASVRLETRTEVAFLTAVDGNFFSVLEVPMALGRPIAPTDDQAGAEAVAVLAHRWWQQGFGGDSSVIGQTVYLNYRAFTVVGVAAADFVGTSAGYRPHVWIPIAPFRDRYTNWAAQAESRDVPLVRVYARLRDGADTVAAAVELRTLAAQLDAKYPLRAGPRQVRMAPATWIDPRTRAAELPTVRLMLLAGCALLALVCANVANLLLAIAASRQRELAVRSALGASPGRLFRAVLVENVLLSIVAGVVALIVAVPASARLGSYFARPSIWGVDVPRESSVDLRVAAFAIGVAILTGVIAGLLPAIRAARGDPSATLRSDATLSWTRPGRRTGLHDVLVTSQVGLAVVLLVVAGLVLRTLASARGVDAGFDVGHLVGSYISTSSTGVVPADRDRYFRELARRLAEEPWVRQATITDNAPLSPLGSMRFRIEGSPEPAPFVTTRVVPGFFEAVGIGVVEGRPFTVGDTAKAPDVAIVNEAAARRLFGGGTALGRRLWLGTPADSVQRGFEIVGIARNAKASDFLAPVEPVVYLAYPQHSYPSGSALIVRTGIDPAAAVPRLTAWLRQYEPHIAIVNVVPYTEVIRGFLYVQRMNAELFATLAFLGLTLATVGIYSIVSLAVGRRRREFGIRMAVGARPGDIRRLVVQRAMTPVAVGLAAGLAVAIALSRLVRSLLYGVEPTDPTALVVGVAVLVLAALVAALVPARRATRIDPANVLRSE